MIVTIIAIITIIVIIITFNITIIVSISISIITTIIVGLGFSSPDAARRNSRGREGGRDAPRRSLPAGGDDEAGYMNYSLNSFRGYIGFRV